MKNKKDKENNSEIFVKDDNIMFGYFNVCHNFKCLVKYFL